MRVVVTGASGFIGSHLLPFLSGIGDFEVIATSRKHGGCSGALEWRHAPELGADADWSSILRQAHAVVHLAGCARIGKATEAEEKLHQRINTEGTKRLARQAAQCEVRRFVFLSSCHAVAAESDAVITAESMPHPSSAYGRSKLGAEQAVRQELAGSGCTYTILRPPAVYGSGNTANITALRKAVERGLPLPLASVRNRRSFLYVGNLVDAISKCLLSPQAAGKIFLPSDGRDVSTPEFIRAIARAALGTELGAGNGEREPGTEDGQPAGNTLPATRHSPLLFPFPESVLKAVARLPGMGALRQLTSSLYVDSEPLRRDLGWLPPFTMEQALRR